MEVHVEIRMRFHSNSDVFPKFLELRITQKSNRAIHIENSMRLASCKAKPERGSFRLSVLHYSRLMKRAIPQPIE
jgi:hypothetical protein